MKPISKELYKAGGRLARTSNFTRRQVIAWTRSSFLTSKNTTSVLRGFDDEMRLIDKFDPMCRFGRPFGRA